MSKTKRFVHHFCDIRHHREAKKSSHNNPNYAAALLIIFESHRAGPKFVITSIENVHT